MNLSLKQEIEALINGLDLDCSIDDFKNEVNWGYISRKCDVSEAFVREFINELSWEVLVHKKFSEVFLREYAAQIPRNYWGYISTYQDLSEAFMRDYSTHLDWSEIPRRQKLSLEFIQEFRDIIDSYLLPEADLRNKIFAEDEKKSLEKSKEEKEKEKCRKKLRDYRANDTIDQVEL